MKRILPKLGGDKKFHDFFRRLNIAQKLTLLMLIVGLLPLLVSVTLTRRLVKEGFDTGTEDAAKVMEEQLLSHLESTRDLKRSAVESFYTQLFTQVKSFTTDQSTIAAMKGFSSGMRTYRRELGWGDKELSAARASLAKYYDEDFRAAYRSKNAGEDVDAARFMEALDDDALALQYAYISANPNPLGSKRKLDTAGMNTTYDRVHAEYHPFLREYLQTAGFYDIFLIDPTTWEVVYSVCKEADFASSLREGLLADTNLAQAVREAVDPGNEERIRLVDFKPYLPSYDAPASFIAAPIEEHGKTIGIAAFQLPLETLSRVINLRAGLGETGESYLIGPDGRMRTDSYRDPEGHSVAASFRQSADQRMTTPQATRGVKGESGTFIGPNYAGIEVLAAYGPLDLPGIRYGIVVEIEESEAMEPLNLTRATFAEAQNHITTWQLGIGLLATLFMIGAAVYFGRLFSKPIRQTVTALHEISEGRGDLTKRLEVLSEDETGELAGSFNRFVENMRELISQIRVAATNVTSASTSVSSASSEISNSVQSQAESLEESAASLEEITATSKQSSDNAAQGALVAQEAQASAERGEELMSDVINAMDDINKSARQIAEIISTIDEIAFQTNLLALNAAVEAARAGEHGRGFTVVATEVRGLAQRSSEAAHEIRDLIQGSVRKVEHGVGLVQTSGQSLQEIIKSVRRVTSIIGEIANATQEQSTGISEVNRAISMLDQSTQSSAVQVQDLTNTATMLEREAKALQDLVGNFILDDNDTARAEAMPDEADTDLPAETPEDESGWAREDSWQDSSPML